MLLRAGPGVYKLRVLVCVQCVGGIRGSRESKERGLVPTGTPRSPQVGTGPSRLRRKLELA